MTDPNRTKRLQHELAARREQTSTARKGFLDTIASSDDADAILEAARGELAARGDLKAIELASKQLSNLDEAGRLGVEFAPGLGDQGRLEAARRFAKDGAR